MAEKKTKKTGYSKPKRFSFPDQERIFPWLPTLLDAYYIIDRGIAEAIKTETKKTRQLACIKGCSNCCKTHRTIPVYPMELVGITWYATEQIFSSERETLRNFLETYKKDNPCPFLADNFCLIHPMRPISCRQFIVFGKQCDEGEDPYYTRHGDVLKPIQKYVDDAFFLMLPFYGIKKKSDRLKAIKNGEFHKVVRLIQDCNWKTLANKMEDYDRKKAGS